MSTAAEREEARINRAFASGGQNKAPVAPLATDSSKLSAPAKPAPNSARSPRSAISNPVVPMDIKVEDLGATSTHTIPQEEKARFVEHINLLLKDDPDLTSVIPIDSTSMIFFEVVKDGVLLAKLIDTIAPGNIDIKKIHKNKKLTRFNIVENLNAVISGARKLGVNLVNIGVVDLEEGKPHLTLGLVWQLFKAALVANMASTAANAEDAAKMKANPQQTLLNWLNDTLKKAGSTRVVKNLTSDISDSVAYTELLNFLAGDSCSKKPLDEKDLSKRAELLLQEADKINCRKFVTAKDIVDGQPNLNFAFLANIYNSLHEIESGKRNVPAAPEPAKKSSEVEHLEATLARLKKENEELKLKLSQQESLSVSLQEKSNSQAVENQQLREKFSQLEEAFNKKSDGDLQALKNKIDQESSEKAALLTRIKNLEDQLESLQKKYDAQSKEKNELARELEKSESEISKLDATIQKMDVELDEKDENIRDLLRQLTELKDLYDQSTERLKKYVYDEYIRNETLREKQEKTLKVSVRDARVGSNWAGWLLIRGNPIPPSSSSLNIHFDESYYEWSRRYFVLKNNHLFRFLTDKDSGDVEVGRSIRLVGGCTVSEIGELEDVRVKDPEKLLQKEIERRTKVLTEKEKVKLAEKEKKKAEADEKRRKKLREKSDSNIFHTNVFQLEFPDMGDMLKGRKFIFSAENETDYHDWIGKLREAIGELPTKEQVFLWVVPEAKKISDNLEKISQVKVGHTQSPINRAGSGEDHIASSSSDDDSSQVSGSSASSYSV